MALALLGAAGAGAQTRWSPAEGNGIVWRVDAASLPHADHIEMSGERMAVVLRWGVDAEGRFLAERSLVFPLLRTLPDNTHASLMHRMAGDIPSLVTVGGLPLRDERVECVEIDGCVRVRSRLAVGKANVGTGGGTATRPVVEAERVIFPSTDKPLMGEIYTLRNIADRAIVLHVPDYAVRYATEADKGLYGAYTVRADLQGAGTFRLEPGAKLRFGVTYQAHRAAEEPLRPDLDAELAARLALVAQLDDNLVLETPDEVIDRAFRFAKIRVSESIVRTAGGPMHAPGGESYYAAIWANDQAEYANPFFPFLGYATGNASALNAFRHFARFMNDDYRPLPSSIIAEGRDIWAGAGDRGDAAMIAYGAARYALARADRAEARELWPLIEWCLEYCRRQVDADGVVASDSDELEGRFPSGDANLCTSTLCYDALLSAAALGRELGVDARRLADYRREAVRLAAAIERHFGAEVGGFATYRYYAGCELLRSWICMPLIAGLVDRAEGTVAALTSPALFTADGVLTQQGSDTFWDRSTLYALRGMYVAGATATAGRFLHDYSARRLLGDHVPYPIEAWPEGSQRHLAAESGLYCRVVTEGMFGIRPTGFRSFTLAPRLAEGWDRMALRRIRAFGGDFDLEVRRIGDRRLEIAMTDRTTGRVRTVRIAEGGETTLRIQ